MATVYLTIKRTTTLGGNLQVTLNVTGTAVPGTDYNFTSGYDSYSAGVLLVTIPTGLLEQTVVIDTTGSPPSQLTATFTVVGGGAYIGVFPSVQTLTINPSPVGDYCDLVVPQPILAYGLRRLRSGYTGFACRVQHSVTGLQMDVPILGNGVIDVSAVSTFMGSNSAIIVNWYNQGTAGSAGDATVDGGEIYLGFNGIIQTKNGVPVLYQRNTRLYFPTLSLIGSGLQNIYMCYAGGMAGTRHGRMLNGATSWVFGYDNAISGRYSVFAFNASIPLANPLSPGESIMRIYSMQSNSPITSPAECYENSVPQSGSGQSQLPNTDIRSNGLSSQHSHSYLGEYVIYTTRLNSTERAFIEDAQRIYFGA